MDGGAYQAPAGPPYLPPQPAWVATPPAALQSQPLLRPPPDHLYRQDDQDGDSLASAAVCLLFLSGFCCLLPWCFLFTLCHGSRVQSYQRLSDASASLFLFFSAILSVMVVGFILLTGFGVVMYLIFVVFFPMH